MRLTAEAALGLAWVLDRMGNDVYLDAKPASPWVSVDFPTRPEQFAIWMSTGAVYRVGADGAVEEDPIFEPGDYARQQAADRLLRILDRVTSEKEELESIVRGVAERSGVGNSLIQGTLHKESAVAIRDWVKAHPVVEDQRPRPGA